uniref:Uncharacterized protein n=1 Tax=Glossina austeni TaxID=7395 RepID=A0A1A9VC52_GLOAU
MERTSTRAFVPDFLLLSFTNYKCVWSVFVSVAVLVGITYSTPFTALLKFLQIHIPNFSFNFRYTLQVRVVDLPVDMFAGGSCIALSSTCRYHSEVFGTKPTKAKDLYATGGKALSRECHKQKGKATREGI